MSLSWSDRDYLIAGLLGGLVLILYILVIWLFVQVNKLQKLLRQRQGGNPGGPVGPGAWAPPPVQQQQQKFPQQQQQQQQQRPPQQQQGYRQDEISSRGFQEYQGRSVTPQSPGPYNQNKDISYGQGNSQQGGYNQGYGQGGGQGYNNGGYRGETPQSDTVFTADNVAKAAKYGAKGFKYAEKAGDAADAVGNVKDTFGW